MTYDNPVKGLARVLGLALAMVEGGEGVNVRLRDGNGPVEYTVFIFERVNDLARVNGPIADRGG